MAFHRKGASFLTQSIDDAAFRLTAVKDIVEHLQEVRVIVSLKDLQTRFPGTRIPVDELCKDDRVEFSLEQDRFKFIPKITKIHGEFINNKHELFIFLTKNPNGIKLTDLSDAYRGIDRDILDLVQTGSALTINPHEWKENARVMTAEARAKREKEQQELPKWYIAPDDHRVLYPAPYWLSDESLVIEGVQTDIEPMGKEYLTLWRETKIPSTMAEVRNFLTENKHEVLTEKASR